MELVECSRYLYWPQNVFTSYTRRSGPERTCVLYEWTKPGNRHNAKPQEATLEATPEATATAMLTIHVKRCNIRASTSSNMM